VNENFVCERSHCVLRFVALLLDGAPALHHEPGLGLVLLRGLKKTSPPERAVLNDSSMNLRKGSRTRVRSVFW
jgi:hypothetical protein